MRAAIKQEMEESVAPLEKLWAYQRVQEVFEHNEEVYWFERAESPLRRSFSVWRFFRITATSLRLIWRTAVALGRGPVSERHGVLTWTSPREFEIYAGLMRDRGLELTYFECDSRSSIHDAIEQYTQYRKDNYDAMLMWGWRSLGALIEGDDYLTRFQRLNAESEFLYRVVSGERHVSAELVRFERSLDIKWSAFAVPVVDDEDLLRHRCGVAAVKLWYDDGDVQDISDAWLAYNLGAWWFGNREISDALLVEMASLIEGSRVSAGS